MRRLVLFLGLVCIVASCNLFKAGKQIDNELIPIKSGEKWGYISSKGKIEINPQFETANFFTNEGLALVRLDGKYGYISKDGKFTINPIYLHALSFSEGLACVVPENGKPQFINKKNEIVISSVDADYCGSFVYGLAIITKVDEKGISKHGFINKKGEVVINPLYSQVKCFSEGLAAVAKTQEKENKDLWGYIDASGKIVINFQFHSAGSFSDGIAAVSDGKKFGFIDDNGKYLINPQFDEVSRFEGNLAVFKQGKNYGYIDRSGKISINPQFEEAYPFTENKLALIKTAEGKWGFIDENGKTAINPQFEHSLPFLDDYAMVISADKLGLIESEGHYLVNPQFDAPSPYEFLFTLIEFNNYCLEDVLLGRMYRLQSDYFDVVSASKKYIGFLTDKNILTYSSTTTLGTIRSSFPENEYSSDRKVYKVKLDSPSLAKNLDVKELQFSFNEDIAELKPIYKIERRFSYAYYQYVNQRVFDHFESEYLDNSILRLISVDLELKDNNIGKGSPLVKQISSELLAGGKYKEVDVGVSAISDKDPKQDVIVIKDATHLFVLICNNSMVSFMNFVNPTEFENITSKVVEYVKENLHVKVASEKELEERRIADSIRVADSLAMLQAEQQRIADSIAYEQARR